MTKQPSFRAAPAFALLAAALLAATSATAQPNRPIYTVYEGHVLNDDGTAVLVFGYYNHNSVPVEIPAGEANGFNPGPADRGQPTVFEPGRQRNVCLIVLPDDYEGNLGWTLTWAERTQTTTERGGIDPLYLIENISMPTADANCSRASKPTTSTGRSRTRTRTRRCFPQARCCT